MQGRLASFSSVFSATVFDHLQYTKLKLRRRKFREIWLHVVPQVVSDKGFRRGAQLY